MAFLANDAAITACNGANDVVLQGIVEYTEWTGAIVRFPSSRIDVVSL
jgi:hypothetical protein